MNFSSVVRCLAVACVVLVSAGAVMAQGSPTATPAEVVPVTDDLATPAQSAGTQLAPAVEVRNAFAETLASAPQVPGDIATALAEAGDWQTTALLLTVLGLAAAFAGRWGGTRLLRPLRDAVDLSDAAARAETAIASVMTTIAAGLGWIVLGLAALLIVTSGQSYARWTAVAVLIVAMLFLLLRDLAKTVLSPGKGELRLMGLDDEEAERLYTRFVIVIGVAAVFFFASIWLRGMGLSGTSADFVQLVGVLYTNLSLAVLAIVHRKPIARVIVGDRARPSAVRAALAASWHVLVAIYLVFWIGVAIVNVLTSDTFRSGPILGPLFAALAGLVVYGLAVIVIERRSRSNRDVLAAAITPAAEDQSSDSDGNGDEAPKEAAENPQPIALWIERWRLCGRAIARFASILISLFVLGAVWGLIGTDPSSLRLVSIAVILLAAYALYTISSTWIDGRMSDDAPTGDGDSEDGMGPGASRLSTLLPLLRTLLTVVVISVIAMVVLAALGVDVAPLFAGAGVIGLAVGFGAQTLIRDIFSGAFFLLDDAFRRGEYVDIAGTTGAVEKISVRSLQLRHHNGPLHTIPFGEIKQLTNFSRDWVIMKLKLRLVYGTDIERVRKLVKKLGQTMAADPDIGHLFMEPLKSQGVIEMEDSAMILRVKFKTKPGDQFVARREVYTRINQLFADEGIQFASRHVTVRVEGDGSAPEAALGAAQTALEAQPAR